MVFNIFELFDDDEHDEDGYYNLTLEQDLEQHDEHIAKGLCPVLFLDDEHIQNVNREKKGAPPWTGLAGYWCTQELKHVGIHQDLTGYIKFRQHGSQDGVGTREV